MFLIRTDRLIITEFNSDMAQAVHENSLDEDTRRFTPDEVFETTEDAQETIEFLRTQYGGSEGPLVYPVLNGEKEYLGYVQAVPLGNGDWEIGYHIGIGFTKKGYATEAVRAFLPVIMKHLRIDRIYGISLLENRASRRVMEKCGFELEFEGVGGYQGEQRKICRYCYHIS